MEVCNNVVSVQKDVVCDFGDGIKIQCLGSVENLLNKVLVNFYVVVENYLELKVNEIIQQLMEELFSIENCVVFVCQVYNDGVMSYNIFWEQFFNNILVGLCVFKEIVQLELEILEVCQVFKVVF